MAKTKTMVLDFDFSFPFLPVSKENVFLVSGKSGFSFWFQFCLREGDGVFLPPLTFPQQNFEEEPVLVHEFLFPVPSLSKSLHT